MPYIVVRGRRANWDEFKRRFAEGQAQRQAMGVRSEQVFRCADDPLDGIVLFEVDDVERGRQAIESPEAQQMRARSGVSDLRIYLPES